MRRIGERTIGDTIEICGRVYKLYPEMDNKNCEGCAFYEDKGDCVFPDEDREGIELTEDIGCDAILCIFVEV